MREPKKQILSFGIGSEYSSQKTCAEKAEGKIPVSLHVTFLKAAGILSFI
jgi:hypothetical protein